MEKDNVSRGWLKTWLVAIRPFALSASVTPVIFGTIMAVVVSGTALRPWLFVFAAVAMMALHSGSNLLNDYFDYREGLDKVPNPGSGAIVRGWLTPRQVLAGAIVLLGFGILLGLIILSQVGLVLIWIGVIGVGVGVLYTLGPVAMKYHGLGDLGIFLAFGPLAVLGAWVVQTGSYSLLPVIWSLPLSLLAVGILHANNWRDHVTDGQIGIRTPAMLFGEKLSRLYYGLLIFGPFLFVLVFVLGNFVFPWSFYPMPWPFLLTMLALPVAIRLWLRGNAFFHRRISAEAPEIATLDAATAQLHLLFGMLSCVALIVVAVCGR